MAQSYPKWPKLPHFTVNLTIQDDFQSCRLESLLLRYMNRVNLDTVEDVLQILHKCVARVERLRDLKIRYQ